MTIHDTLLAPGLKGFPIAHAPIARDAVATAGWNVLAGDLPLPLALLKREALQHNLHWMQERARAWQVDLAPHGKTTMSPQLFRQQLDAGAWGLSFATVHQLAIGVAAGVRRALIANQVVHGQDLASLQSLLSTHADLRVVFLVDSLAQAAIVDAWSAAHPGALPFEVLLEIGVEGGRTGCRTHQQAMALAQALHDSPAMRLVGIECYEGLGATGDSVADAAFANALMDRVAAVAQEADKLSLFETDEVLVSAGGSAIFDLVATRLRPSLTRPTRGLIRPGCYLAHDHGFYTRMLAEVERRCGCTDTLRPAMEVWAMVQSRPEPGVAILAVGKRDISFDLSLPMPIARAAADERTASPVPAGWKITALNDQHAYLRWDAAEEAEAPKVGDRVGLGISHPCTTFDKWHWMPVVENDYTVTDAVTLHF
ncbi:amino acid deaminase [Xylophilus rhododendri]|uniref:Amino acid deaminase n=1 Tax=Xylophilus rhododendri TaxID=2697032 RepID=A0A857J636_9BURK|nr:alanine racemase [Xylophilus rhododendri]QHI98482.1 amino acid deaminase [Xylophilus rhododendri]